MARDSKDSYQKEGLQEHRRWRCSREFFVQQHQNPDL